LILERLVDALTCLFFYLRTYSYVRQLLQDQPETATTTALTRFIVANAASLAERCVADTVGVATDTAAAAERGKKKSLKSRGIVEKFLNQVFFERQLFKDIYWSLQFRILYFIFYSLYCVLFRFYYPAAFWQQILHIKLNWIEIVSYRTVYTVARKLH